MDDGPEAAPLERPGEMLRPLAPGRGAEVEVAAREAGEERFEAGLVFGAEASDDEPAHRARRAGCFLRIPSWNQSG